jgi:hypothetical protein
VLTHHPEDAEPVDDVIGTQLLERGGLIDEATSRSLTRLLGDGTCLYDVAGASMRKLQNLGPR